MLHRCLPAVGLIVLACVWPGASAIAQAMAATPGWVSGGYHGAAATVTQPFAPSTRDGNGNRIVSNGEIALAGVTSVAEKFGAVAAGAQTYLSGAGTSPAGGTSATAIGNLSQIQVIGSGNTIIATVTQTNTGPVTATTTATVSSK